MTTQTITASDNWSIEREQLKIGERITATYEDDGLEIILKEYPNGAAVYIRRPADLPGGYTTVAEEEYTDYDEAFKEFTAHVERYENVGHKSFFDFINED